jgi:hypothetical protein
MQALGNAGVESTALDLQGHGGSDGHESLQQAGIEDYVADAYGTQASLDTPHLLPAAKLRAAACE